jgi:two-component system, NarL family, sensor histidine kinase UhpB
MSRPLPPLPPDTPALAAPLRGRRTLPSAWIGRWPERLGSGFRSARRSLALLVLAAAIPMLLFGMWAAYLAAERERAGIRSDILGRVEDVTERVAAELMRNLEAAVALAASTALDGDDLGAFYVEAVRLKSDRPLWHTVELADPSGAQVLNLLRPLGSPLGPTAERESFEKVVATRRPAVSGIGPIGPVSGLQLVALRVPVIRGGELRYVLSIALEPGGVSSILRDAGVPPGWIGGVVDAKGDIVARTQGEPFEIGRPASAAVREAIKRAPQGFYRGHTLEGVEVEVAYQPLPHPDGWTVHFGVSSAMLDGPIEKSQYLLAAGGAASLVLAAFLAFMVARDIAQRRADERARAGRILRASEEHRAMAVEAAALGTWQWDVRKDRIAGSARAGNLFGLPQVPAGGCSGWRYADLAVRIHPDDRQRLDAAARQCLESGDIVDIEFRTVREDGSTHWIRAIGRSHQSGQDRPGLLHGVIADIDLRKRADAEHAALLRRLAQVQEDERRHIARELHDQVGQTVTGLGLGLKGLEQMIENRGPGAPMLDRVRWLRRLTADVGRDLHRVASDLRPTALDDLGLEKALRAYAADWSGRYGVSIDVQSIGSGDRLPAETEIVVYRAVQEGLTNVLKHASATAVSVLLERKGGYLRVIIEDDGKGFDVTEEGSRDDGRPRLGLSGIRERLSLIGGTVTVESTEGAGTTLFIRVPTASGEQGSAP